MPTTTPTVAAKSALNRAELKRRIIRLAAKHRPGWSPGRVSDVTVEACEFALDRYIVAELMRQPSLGKTVIFK
jgi:hypothetical protein